MIISKCVHVESCEDFEIKAIQSDKIIPFLDEFRRNLDWGYSNSLGGHIFCLQKTSTPLQAWKMAG